MLTVALCRRRQLLDHAHRHGRCRRCRRPIRRPCRHVALASAAPTTRRRSTTPLIWSSFPDVRAVTPVTATSTTSSRRRRPRRLNRSSARCSRAASVPRRCRQRCRNCGAIVRRSRQRRPDADADRRAPQPLDLFSDRSGTFAELIELFSTDREADGRPSRRARCAAPRGSPCRQSLTRRCFSCLIKRQ